jgi:hypothetical protein
VDHYVEIDMLDAAPSYKFTWTDVAGYKFQGTILALEEDFYVGNTYTTMRNVAQEVSGEIDFVPGESPPGHHVSGSAPSVHVTQTIGATMTHRVAEILSRLNSRFGGGIFPPGPDEQLDFAAADEVEPPPPPPPPDPKPVLEFLSSVNELAPDSFEYRYVVTNFTGEAVSFDWAGAGVAGIVEGDADPADPTDNVFTVTRLSPLPGIEVDGSATFGPAGPLGDGEMVANAFVPIPEPSGVLMLGAAGLLGLRRPRRR